MGVFFRDEFDGVAGTLLDAHTPDVGIGWTKNPDSSATQEIEILTSGLASNTIDDNLTAIYYADAPPDDSLYRAKLGLVVSSADVGFDVGATVRQSTASRRSYRTVWDFTVFRILRATPAAAGTSLVAFSGAADLASSGDTAELQIEAEGTTLRGKVTDPLGDVYTAEAIDSVNATGGRPGIWSRSRNFKVDYDYFEASDGPEDTGGAGTTIDAVGGSFSLTGGDVNLTVQRQLSSNPGTLSLTGSDATLTYAPVASFQLDANPGTFSFTGGEVLLTVQRALQADAGSYTLTGSDVELSTGLAFTANSGTFSLTGGDVTFSRGYALSLEPGEFTITGSTVNLSYSGEARVHTINGILITGASVNGI